MSVLPDVWNVQISVCYVPKHINENQFFWLRCVRSAQKYVIGAPRNVLNMPLNIVSNVLKPVINAPSNVEEWQPN
ncbi:hypothetical protein PJ15_2332 [Acinetobacter sp. neg1]|nr:hypothetical protein PJ15_2332 [Acinetobacter sp. neg1]